MQLTRQFKCPFSDELICSIFREGTVGGDVAHGISINGTARLLHIHQWLERFSMEQKVTRGYKDMRAMFERCMLTTSLEVWQDRNSTGTPLWFSFLEECP